MLTYDGFSIAMGIKVKNSVHCRNHPYYKSREEGKFRKHPGKSISISSKDINGLGCAAKCYFN
jgi:hypothetical protein